MRPSVNSPASVAYHGDRLTAARMLEVMDDSIDCPFMDDYSPDEQAEPLDPLPCPITLAWAQFDRLVPAETYGHTARERLPGATWVLLPGRRTPSDGRRPGPGGPDHHGRDRCCGLGWAEQRPPSAATTGR